MRRRRGRLALAPTGAVTTAHIIDAGEGVRLQGLHTVIPGHRPRGLALLLHGWEGSADSSYMQLTAAHLLARGFEVFRLNFRDHGDTHHLNEGLFHSNRIDEVVTRRRKSRVAMPRGRWSSRGIRCGGNFALRVALRAQAAGIPLGARCGGMPGARPLRGRWTRWNTALPLYMWYFERKWRGSLRTQARRCSRSTTTSTTACSACACAADAVDGRAPYEFGSLDRYFDGYSIAGDRLAALRVPASILMAADDPVIPVAGFHALHLSPETHLEIAAHGGHCGFIENWQCDGFAERWVADRLEAAVSAFMAPSPAFA